jgi:GH15 family glucan-1,4-alpha-glucosidase
MPADLCCLRPEGPPSAGGYLRIGEHGLIGDLHTVALVGVEGTIDWYRPGRSVFGALRDARRGGHWSLCPAGGRWRSRQRYVPDTNLLVTRFSSDEGELEIQDFMPVGATPGTLVRRVAGVRGEPHLVMEVEPRFDCAPRSQRVELGDDGARFTSAGRAFALHAPVRLRATRAGVQAKFCLAPAEVLTLVLCPADAPPPVGGGYEGTIAFWRGWLADSGYGGRWREEVRRSALAVELLEHAAAGVPVNRDAAAPRHDAAAGFRAAERLARGDRLDEARVAFENALGSANHLGLLSESVGEDGGQLGTFPHAAAHTALISAARAIGLQGASGKT